MRLYMRFMWWLVLTIGLQLVFVALYGIYDYGMGPYQCGFIDAGHYCSLGEYVANKFLVANLAFAIPTIISGLISWAIVHFWQRKR